MLCDTKNLHTQLMHAAAERAIHYACAQFNIGQFQSQRMDVQYATKDKMQVPTYKLLLLHML